MGALHAIGLGGGCGLYYRLPCVIYLEHPWTGHLIVFDLLRYILPRARLLSRQLSVKRPRVVEDLVQPPWFGPKLFERKL